MLAPVAVLVIFVLSIAIGIALGPLTDAPKWQIYLSWCWFRWRFWYRRKQIRALGGTTCNMWETGTLCCQHGHSALCSRYIEFITTHLSYDRVVAKDYHDRITWYLMCQSFAISPHNLGARYLTATTAQREK